MKESKTNNIVIVKSYRTPFSRYGSMYPYQSVDDIVLKCLTPLIKDLKLEGKPIGELVLGSCALHVDQHGIARDIVIRTKLEQDSPAFSIRKGCISSMEAVNLIANKIALGQIDCGIACGGESTTDMPVEFSDLLSHWLLLVV